MSEDLLTKSSAPDSSARVKSSLFSRPVSINTATQVFVSRRNSLICRQTSMPLISGITRSTITQSKFPRCT